MSKHTPATWVFDEPENWRGLAARVCTANNEPIAQVSLSGWGKKQGLSHARLIAAAPDLLEFAQEVRCNGDTRLASMAIAVIAKATGEQP